MSDDSKMTFSGGLLPHCFTFYNANQKVLTFNHDGSVEIGPGLTPDEAGQQAVAAMTTSFKGLIDSAVAAKREACAKLAEQFFDQPNLPRSEFAGHGAGRAIARCIRALK